MTKEQRKQRVKSIYKDVTSKQIDLISTAIAKVMEVLLSRLVELNYFNDINISKH